MSKLNVSIPAGGHGAQGARADQFTRLIDPDDFTRLQLGPHPEEVFRIVAAAMDQGIDPADGSLPADDSDPQENPRIAAGYTYFGQFIDHDLTFDTTSTLDPHPQAPSNERTPRLDLDCVYGPGFASAPYMYVTIDDATGARAGEMIANKNGFDLLRVIQNGTGNDDRAVIGDPRNDENSIICQLQLGFIRFHNKVVKTLIDQGKATPGGDAFAKARQEVRWTYQSVLMNDYLVRIIQDHVVTKFTTDLRHYGRRAFVLYTDDKWGALPLEFTAAAYRFGHSMIRNAYRMNTGQATPQLIFDAAKDNRRDSLVGFGNLDTSHQIDWSLLLPNPNDPDTAPGQAPKTNDDAKKPSRLQFAYKLDTSVVDPIAHLPAAIAGAAAAAAVPPIFTSLAARNLMRAYNFGVPSGQDVARALRDALDDPELSPLDDADITIRTNNTGHPANPSFKGFDAIDDGVGVKLTPKAVTALTDSTPLWLYVLMEAQKSGGAASGISGIDGAIGFDDDPHKTETTALGEVGGRILLEVFYGILLGDPESVLASDDALNWQPMANPDRDRLTLWDILKFGGSIPYTKY